MRDKGIDLIVYASGVSGLHALPAQLKVATGASFSAYRKYEKVSDLLMAYVWYANEPQNAAIYIMTHRDALEVARMQGYTNNLSWVDKGQYVTNAPSKGLLQRIEQYRYQPGRLTGLLDVSQLG